MAWARAAALAGLLVFTSGAPAWAAGDPQPAAPPASESHELIFAQVLANGRMGTFLVDTGAPTSVLDAGFAARIGAKLGAHQELDGGGRSRLGRVAEDVTLDPQSGPLRQVDLAVTDLTDVVRVLGRPLDGILGGDYFTGMVLTLDYRSGQARFDDPARVRPPPGAAPLRILLSPYIRAVAQVGNRRVTGLYQIDTGSNLAVAFWTPYARRTFPELRGVAGRSVGVAGDMGTRMATLDALELADRRLETLAVDLINETHPNDAGADYAGAIGGPVFAGRVLHLDYARRVMWVE